MKFYQQIGLYFAHYRPQSRLPNFAFYLEILEQIGILCMKIKQQ